MRFMRAGLLLLAAGQLLPGLWALADPVHFYETFPGAFTSAWVAGDGPFNHHLVVDAGAGFAATGVALALAAWWRARRVQAVALVAYLVHAVPHLVYHGRHVPPALGPVEQALTWLPLASGVVLAVALLLAALRPAAAARPPAGVGGSGRIGGISGAPQNLLLRAGFAVARGRLGAVPTAWRVTARVPRVALARMAGDAAHRRTTLVPARLGALATLRAATLVECAFCMDILSAVATREGVRPQQIRDLAGWRDSDAFDGDERLALALADAMTATPATVDDDLAGALVDRFGAEGVIELAAAVGHENARARVNRVLGVPPQGFAAAAACPLPAAS